MPRKAYLPADVASIARQHTGLAMTTLAGICRAKTAPPSARVSAAVALLDRGWGKPDQSHTVNGDQQIRFTIRHILEGRDPEPKAKTIEHQAAGLELEPLPADRERDTDAT